MAFSADELRVLRRALAIALHPAPLPDEDVQDCLRLAGSVDEAVGEAGRLRAFLLADLVRYRNALPGSLSGYLERLQDALAAGYDPRPEDLAALRACAADRSPRRSWSAVRCSRSVRCGPASPDARCPRRHPRPAAGCSRCPVAVPRSPRSRRPRRPRRPRHVRRRRPNARRRSPRRSSRPAVARFPHRSSAPRGRASHRVR